MLFMVAVLDPVQPHCQGSGEFQHSLGKTRHHVNKLEIAKPKYGWVPQHTHPTDIQPIDPTLGVVDITRVMSLWEDLRKNCKDDILFTQVWPSNPDNKQVDRLMKMQARSGGD